MGRAIGIDLGTTNSVVAAADGPAVVLPNHDGQDVTPSVVALRHGTVLVGQAARDRALVAPRDAAYSVRRLIGREFDDPDVRRVRAACSCEIAESNQAADDGVCIVLEGRSYSPTQISTMILKGLKEDAERHLGDAVESAVITVPGYFTERQRSATRKAAEQAGLKVLRLLDEPIAAAIAFGVDNISPDDAKTILVYDLGGATFEASALTLVGGVFAQLSVEGDRWLGGDAFDQNIVDRAVQQIEDVHGIDPTLDASFMVRLKSVAEQAKKRLSGAIRTRLAIPGVLKDRDGNAIDVELDLTRSEFEDMIADQIAKTIELTRTAVRNAGETMSPDQIDHVLLVGGSSQIPLVRKSLATLFGESRLLTNADPMTCVALGAAILAEKMAGAVKCPDGHFNSHGADICEVCKTPLSVVCDHALEVTGVHYGVQAVGDRFEIVIPKGSPFPSTEPAKIQLIIPQDNLRRMRLPIYAGLDPVASRNELQTTVLLELPGNVPSNTPLEVSFSLDSDGILEKVRAVLLDGSGTQMETYLDRGVNPQGPLEKRLDDLKKKRDESALDEASESRFEAAYSKALSALKANGAEAAEVYIRDIEAILSSSISEWRNSAKGLCYFTERVLEYSFLLDPQRCEELTMLLERLQQCIDRDDESAAKKNRAALDKATDDLPAPITVLLGLIRGMHEARSKQMELEAAQIGAAVRSIEAALRDDDHPKAIRLLAEIRPVLDVVNNKTRGDPGTTHGDVLVGSSRHHPSAGSNIAPRSGRRERPRGSPEAPTSRIDKVHFAVSAPATAQPGRTFFVDVYAFLDRERGEVERQIRLAVAETEPAPLIRSQGPFPIRRGTTLHVRLQFADLVVENPEDIILWAGGQGNAAFRVNAPEAMPPGQRIGLITVSWGGCVQVARVPIQVQVTPTPSPSNDPIIHHLQRIQRAFASYAHEDKSAVASRIQGMHKVLPGLDVFWDVVSLRSGDDWETRLWQEIPSRDVFYLFWSRNASKSSWVEKEWRCALETRGLAFIDPIPLESPDVAKPPEELRKKHFNDWHLAYQTPVS